MADMDLPWDVKQTLTTFLTILNPSEADCDELRKAINAVKPANAKALYKLFSAIAKHLLVEAQANMAASSNADALESPMQNIQDLAVVIEGANPMTGAECFRSSERVIHSLTQVTEKGSRHFKEANRPHMTRTVIAMCRGCWDIAMGMQHQLDKMLAAKLVWLCNQQEEEQDPKSSALCVQRACCYHTLCQMHVCLMRVLFTTGPEPDAASHHANARVQR